MAGELSAILDHIEQIAELDLDGVEPTTPRGRARERAARRRAAARACRASVALAQAPDVAGRRLPRPEPAGRLMDVSELLDLTAAAGDRRDRARRARRRASSSPPTARAPPPTS